MERLRAYPDDVRKALHNLYEQAMASEYGENWKTLDITISAELDMWDSVLLTYEALVESERPPAEEMDKVGTLAGEILQYMEELPENRQQIVTTMFAQQYQLLREQKSGPVMIEAWNKAIEIEKRANERHEQAKENFK